MEFEKAVKQLSHLNTLLHSKQQLTRRFIDKTNDRISSLLSQQLFERVMREIDLEKEIWANDSLNK